MPYKPPDRTAKEDYPEHQANSRPKSGDWIAEHQAENMRRVWGRDGDLMWWYLGKLVEEHESGRREAEGV